MKKSIIALLLAVTMMVALGTTAMAANVCTEISGNSGQGSVTFTVETGSRWLFSDKLTLTQTKGSAKGYTIWGTPKTYPLYDRYTVTYVNQSNNKSKTATLSGQKLNLKLDKNTTYKITVRPMDQVTLHGMNLHNGGFHGWDKYPTWRVSSTKGIKMCK